MAKMFIPSAYDADSALGITNEGSYAYEYYQDYEHDKDEIYTGRMNVFWKLVFDNFQTELKTLYQTLRADGTFNVENDLARFKNHANAWGKRAYNHDTYEKHLEEFYEYGSKTYFDMVNGDKLCQTENFLRNRYNYFDEKYIAGKAPQNTIVMRGYAKANIPVKMFSNGYSVIRWGNTYTQEPIVGGEWTTMECPLTNVHDTETMIYMSDEVTGIGDISQYQIGYLDLSKAPRLRSIKIGDESSGYENTHFTTLTVGNNPLMESIDVSNCSALVGSTDLSNCSCLSTFKAYGTNLSSVEFPQTNTLEVVKLPQSINGFSMINQDDVEVTFEDTPTLTSLILEKTSLDVSEYLGYCDTDARIRLIDIDFGHMELEDYKDLLETLSSFRGIDENGNTLSDCKTTVSGTVHFDYISSDDMGEILEYGFEYINITATHSSAKVYYYSDSTYTTLLYTQTIIDGGNAINPVLSGAISTPTKQSTEQYSYTFNGWSSLPTNVVVDKKVYALFTSTIRSYTVTFVNGDETLQTTTYQYGQTPTYTGSTPVDPEGSAFIGWIPNITPVTGNITYEAKFKLSMVLPPLIGVLTSQTRNVFSPDPCGYYYSQGGMFADGVNLDDLLIFAGNDCQAVCPFDLFRPVGNYIFGGTIQYVGFSIYTGKEEYIIDNCNILAFTKTYYPNIMTNTYDKVFQYGRGTNKETDVLFLTFDDDGIFNFDYTSYASSTGVILKLYDLGFNTNTTNVVTSTYGEGKKFYYAPSANEPTGTNMSTFEFEEWNYDLGDSLPENVETIRQTLIEYGYTDVF